MGCSLRSGRDRQRQLQLPVAPGDGRTIDNAISRCGAAASAHRTSHRAIRGPVTDVESRLTALRTAAPEAAHQISGGATDRNHAGRVAMGPHVGLDKGRTAFGDNRVDRLGERGLARNVLHQSSLRIGLVAGTPDDDHAVRRKPALARKGQCLVRRGAKLVSEIGFGACVMTGELQPRLAVDKQDELAAQRQEWDRRVRSEAALARHPIRTLGTTSKAAAIFALAASSCDPTRSISRLKVPKRSVSNPGATVAASSSLRSSTGAMARSLACMVAITATVLQGKGGSGSIVRNTPPASSARASRRLRRR